MGVYSKLHDKIPLKFGSLFSGIGGFDLGLERSGFEIKFQVEIDVKCQDVLRRHFPNTEIFGDVTQCGQTNLIPVDLICGGFPCQDLSMAGRRAGLAGKRSGLWFEFHRIIEELRPGWVVIENVPGLLSSNGGEDFAIILQGLVECGYGVAWRILDAQYFGLAQRRRRVFVVASLGSGCAAQVLFKREGGARDTPPSREEGEKVAICLAPGSRPSGFNGRDEERNLISNTLGSHHGRNDLDSMGAYIPEISLPLAYSRTNDHQDESQQSYIAFSADQDGMDATENLSLTLRHGGDELEHHNAFRKTAVAYNWQSGGDVRLSFGKPTLQANQTPAVGVRRLTPTECCRLQGFPDNWNTHGVDGQGSLYALSDSTRYRQLGNAVAVPCAEWIGKQLLQAMGLAVGD